MSASKPDDLEAVRTVVDTIKDFQPDDQQRIFRWVAEKLGLPPPFAASGHTPSMPPAPSAGGSITSQQTLPAQLPPPGGVNDIKTFIAAKKPRNAVQFAAAVAYYYRFEAPQAERKEAINKDDLQEATRLAGWDRFSDPLNTLANAHKMGLLDKGSEKATFMINSVGENLVAMTLPDGTPRSKASMKKKKPKTGAKNSTKKKGSKA
jgi:hypothetical protein